MDRSKISRSKNDYNIRRSNPSPIDDETQVTSTHLSTADWNTIFPYPVPPGLPNLGNSCFINAIIQCLLTIHPLVSWLLSPRRSREIREELEKNQEHTGRLLTESMSALVTALFRRNLTSELKDFRELIGDLKTEFKDAGEQDAQEFLLFLLNRLHDENSTESKEPSEVRSLLAGKMCTKLVCPDCRPLWPNSNNQSSKHRLLRMHFNFPKFRKPKVDEFGELFLSLSLPIPLEEKAMGELTNTVSDSQNTYLKIIVNELIETPDPLCKRRILTVAQNTNILSAYRKLETLFTSANAHSLNSDTDETLDTKHPQPAALDGSASREKEISRLDCKQPFLLVQATSSGFGDWFLESSGLATQLLDELDIVETSADDSSHLFSDDALFLVHLESNKKNALLDSSQVSQEQECTLELLLLHVEEDEANAVEKRDSSLYRASGSINSSNATFRRLTPPLVIKVDRDVQFCDLRWQVLQSLFEFCNIDEADLPKNMEQISIKLWIVDAGPGESCEVFDDPEQLFPLLHPTVDLSSVSFPDWLCRNSSSKRPKLLRLLVVWPPDEFPKFDRSSCLPVTDEFSASTNIDTSPVTECTRFKKRHNNKKSSVSPVHVSNHFHNRENSQSQNSRKNSVSLVGTTDLAPESVKFDAELTLVDCLKAFVETEQLVCVKTWRCSNCRKSQSQALLKTTIIEAPNYLLLHLNRFVQTSPAGAFSIETVSENCSSSAVSMTMKIDSLVTYPIEGLDLSFMMETSSKKASQKHLTPDWSSSINSHVYDLVAVCNHKGKIDSGHFTAFCRNPLSGQWWQYNDLKMTKVSTDQVVQANAYILFYKRRSTFSDVSLLTKMLVELNQTAPPSFQDVAILDGNCHPESPENPAAARISNPRSGSPHSSNLLPIDRRRISNLSSTFYAEETTL